MILRRVLLSALGAVVADPDVTRVVQPPPPAISAVLLIGLAVAHVESAAVPILLFCPAGPQR